MPIIFELQPDKSTRIAVWSILETEDELYNRLQLNEAEKNFYSGLGKGHRNLHWLGSRVLLRTMLNTTEYIDCQLDENNKPYLVNFPYEISITHSNGLASVIMSKGKKVGIDIEKISNKIERVVKKFLSEAEQSFLSEEFRVEHLYVCWGVKEALFKLYGKGNLPFINGIQIQPFEYSIDGGIISAEISKENYKEKFQVHYQKLNDFMLTWVVEG